MIKPIFDTLVALSLTASFASSADAASLTTRRIDLPYAGTYLDWFPDGRRVVIGAIDGHILVVDVEDGRLAKLVRAREAQNGAPMRVRVSPDGRHVATGGRGASLWDVETWTEHPVALERQPGVAGFVGGMQFAPDGRSLLIAYLPAAAQQWSERASPEPASTLIRTSRFDLVDVERSALSQTLTYRGTAFAPPFVISPDGSSILTTRTEHVDAKRTDWLERVALQDGSVVERVPLIAATRSWSLIQATHRDLLLLAALEEPPLGGRPRSDGLVTSVVTLSSWQTAPALARVSRVMAEGGVRALTLTADERWLGYCRYDGRRMLSSFVVTRPDAPFVEERVVAGPVRSLGDHDCAFARSGRSFAFVVGTALFVGEVD